jgi:hypothetical protein
MVELESDSSKRLTGRLGYDYTARTTVSEIGEVLVTLRLASHLERNFSGAGS